MPQDVTAIIGTSFARLDGSLYTGLTLTSERVVPYIRGQICADTPPFQSPWQWIGANPYSWGVVVYSSEQAPGCGVEGSQITFKLLDQQGNVIATANETATWHAWTGGPDQGVDLTLSPPGGTTITMPNTGTGNGPDALGPLAVGLATVGTAGVAGGLALRRRVATR